MKAFLSCSRLLLTVGAGPASVVACVRGWKEELLSMFDDVGREGAYVLEWMGGKGVSAVLLADSVLEDGKGCKVAARVGESVTLGLLFLGLAPLPLLIMLDLVSIVVGVARTPTIPSLTLPFFFSFSFPFSCSTPWSPALSEFDRGRETSDLIRSI